MSLFNFGFVSSSKRKSTEVCNEPRKEQKKLYDKEKRERKYLGSIWEKKYFYYRTADGKPDGKTDFTTWIKYDAEKNAMHCEVCKEFPALADNDSSLYKGCTNLRDAPLKSHHGSVKHQNCIRAKLALLFPREQPMDKSLSKVSHENQGKMLTLFNSAYFIVKTNMAFRRFPELIKLQTKNMRLLLENNKQFILDNYVNDKSCRMFIRWIAEELKLSLQRNVRKSRFLSILSDGSTDSGNIENELIYIRFINNGEAVTKYAAIEAVKNANAVGTLEAIETGLRSGLKLDKIDDIYLKTVNSNFDGASVMSGVNAGVQALMKKTRPGMLYVHCIAHILELAVLDAVKSDDFLIEFEKTLESIFLMYFYSPKLAREIKNLAEITGQVVRHFGGMKKIRWVASRLRALEALATNYSVMTTHMEHMASQNTPSASDNYAKAISYLSNVKKYRFLQYLHFLIDFVKVLRELSLVFQKETLLVCSVSNQVKKKIALVSNLKDVPGEYYEKLQSELNITDEQEIIFRGINLSDRQGGRTRRQLRIDEIFSNDAEVVQRENTYRDTFENLVQNAESYLQQRFKCFEEKPFVWFKAFDTDLWPADFNALKDIGNEEVFNLLEYYHTYNYISDDERKNARKEWPSLKVEAHTRKYANPKFCPNPYEIYSGILKTPSLTDEMENILVLVEIMMSISVSIASCERGFSQMNNEKTSLRTRMCPDTLDDVLRINVERQSVEEFDPLAAFKLWISDGPKHINGHKLKVKMDEKTMDVASALLIISAEEEE